MTSANSEKQSYVAVAHQLLHETVFDAAVELLADNSWSSISMSALATQAGVSRQTLYNEFGSREQFAQALALREAGRFLAMVEGAIAANSHDAVAAVKAAFSLFISEAETNIVVRAAVAPDAGGDDLFALFTTRGGPVIEFAIERLSAAILLQWPANSDQAVRVVAEGLVRLGISYAGLATSSNELAAETVTALIAPYIEHHLVV